MFETVVNVSCALFLFVIMTLFLQRWLKQALEEEGSTSPGRRPSLLMPGEGPLSPSINGDSDSPLPYNGICSLPGKSGFEQINLMPLKLQT